DYTCATAPTGEINGTNSSSEMTIAVPADALPVIGFRSGLYTMAVAKCTTLGCGPTQWNVKTIDGGACCTYNGMAPTMALASSGNPVLAWSGGGSNLKVGICSDPQCLLGASITTSSNGGTTYWEAITMPADQIPTVHMIPSDHTLRQERCTDTA